MKDNIYYSIEKRNDKWAVWRNAEKEHSVGCYGLFSGTLRECVRYAKENKIRIKGGRKNLADELPTWRELLKKHGTINN